MPPPFGPVIQALGPVPNDQVIKKFVDFVNQKKIQPTCTPATVVDDFCNILVKILKMKPTKKITPQKIMVLVREMNDAAETAGWHDSQREWIINKILDLFGGQKLDASEVPKTRNWFTPSGASLTKATMEATTKAGGVYSSRTYNDKKSKPVQWANQLELDQQLNHSSNFVTGITYIERKECAICWMCKKPIYVYKYTVNGTEYFFSCGQDEHVLPPGWGNILGILWSDLKDQSRYNSCPSSLSPSHAWCNQLKNDELLLLLPRFIQNKFTSFQINNAGFARFVAKGVKWLTTGNNIIDHNMFYRNLTNPPNVYFLNQLEADQFMQSMVQTMRLHLLKLIGELEYNIVNPTAGAGSITTDHYTVFILRTILCLAYMWNKIIINRSNKKGSNKKGGGDHPEQDNKQKQKIAHDDDDADDNGYGYYNGSGDKDKLMPHLYVAGLFDKNEEFDEDNIFNDKNTFYPGDTILDEDYEIKEDMPSWQEYIKDIYSRISQQNINESFMVNAFGIGNIIFKVYKPQAIVIDRINLTKMMESSDPVTVPTAFDMLPSAPLSWQPPAPQSGPFVPPSSMLPTAPLSGPFAFGQPSSMLPTAPLSGPFAFGQPFGMLPSAPQSGKFHAHAIQPSEVMDFEVEGVGGGKYKSRKYKSQKYKSQKYKSQKYKTRKHKSQKQKNRKKHKSRKHKSRKHK